jgi:hypothetical protein
VSVFFLNGTRVKYPVFIAVRDAVDRWLLSAHDTIGDFRRRLHGHEQRARREDPERARGRIRKTLTAERVMTTTLRFEAVWVS